MYRLCYKPFYVQVALVTGFLHHVLQYVGVISIVFHVLQLLLIRSTQKKELLLHQQIYSETSAKT